MLDKKHSKATGGADLILVRGTENMFSFNTLSEHIIANVNKWYIM